MKGLGIEYPGQITKQQAKYAIEMKLANQATAPQPTLKDEIEVVKVEKPLLKTPYVRGQASANGQKAMYVSYAKDIFIAIQENSKMDNRNATEDMNIAISLVKQAQEAFS